MVAFIYPPADLALPAHITLITTYDDRDKKTAQDKITLLLNHADDPGAIKIAPTDKNTRSAITAALEECGIKFLSLPFIWGDKKIGSFLINPAAITHLCVSKPHKNYPNPDSIGLIFSLRGGAGGETHALPQETAQKFMDAVKDANPQFKIISAPHIYSRFFAEECVLYDPAQIARITSNGDHGVNIIYRNGHCSDFTFEQESQADRHSLQKSFAAAIAKDATGLITLPGTKNIFYGAAENISTTHIRNNILDIHYSLHSLEGRGLYDRASIAFADNKAARIGLAHLQKHTRLLKNDPKP